MLEQSLWDEVKKLDEKFQKNAEDYHRHRNGLLTTLEYITGVPSGQLTGAGVTVTSEGIAIGPSQTKVSSSPPPRPIEMLGVPENEAKSQLMIVLAAVQKLQGQFDKDAVRKKLEESELRSVVTENTLKNISSFLWRLHKDNCINIVEKGQGHRQSVYVKSE